MMQTVLSALHCMKLVVGASHFMWDFLGSAHWCIFPNSCSVCYYRISFKLTCFCFEITIIWYGLITKTKAGTIWFPVGARQICIVIGQAWPALPISIPRCLERGREGTKLSGLKSTDEKWTKCITVICGMRQWHMIIFRFLKRKPMCTLSNDLF